MSDQPESVQRYNLWWDGRDSTKVLPCVDGYWVKHADHCAALAKERELRAALEAKCAELFARHNSFLKSVRETAGDFIPSGPHEDGLALSEMRNALVCALARAEKEVK